MTREELIETGARALTEAFGSPSGSSHAAEVILDAVEPLIRDDERAQLRLDGESPSSEWHLEYLQDQANTLRAKVEALRDELKAKAYAVRDTEGWGNIMLMADGVQRALDLIDGKTK